MFGYLQPDREELKVREYELYKSVYCGLCKELGKSYGIISRLTLSYDCTVLAMLSLSLKSEKSKVTKGSCVCNPTKKCLYCSGNGDSFKFAGAVSVIMAYYKLQDTAEDSRFLKKLFALMLKKIFSHTHKKAAMDYPKIEKIVKEMMENQKTAERENSSIDKSADSTAKMLSELCLMLSEDNTQKKVLGVFGYYLGRWIYLIDAADDIEKDVKHNNFNPFKERYDNDINSLMSYCNDVLNMTVSQITSAYNLLEIIEYKEILDNIIYNGLALKQRYSLFDKYKKKDKSERNYYSTLSRKE